MCQHRENQLRRVRLLNRGRLRLEEECHLIVSRRCGHCPPWGGFCSAASGLRWSPDLFLLRGLAGPGQMSISTHRGTLQRVPSQALLRGDQSYLPPPLIAQGRISWVTVRSCWSFANVSTVSPGSPKSLLDCLAVGGIQAHR